MNALVIYDNEGYVLSVQSGEPAPREPVGVPFLWVDVPKGKYISRVDTSKMPHEPVFGYIVDPVSDIGKTLADLTFQLMIKGVL